MATGWREAPRDRRQISLGREGAQVEITKVNESRSSGSRARTSPSAPRRRARKAAQAPIKSSLEYALLGLISETSGISGYAIAKTFELETRHYWHALAGQIYRTLDRMESAGWITSRQVIQQGRPNKREYRANPDGERALVRWLNSPLERMKLKNPLLLRTRFLGHVGAAAARAQIHEQRRGAERYLDELRGIERAYFPEPRAYPDVNAMFSYFTLRYGIAWMEQTIIWCDWALAEISRGASASGAELSGSSSRLSASPT